MTDLTANTFNEWASSQDKTNERGYRIYPDNLDGMESPWGEVEFVDEYRDYSDYSWVFKVGDRYFEISGYYDSQMGVDLYGSEEFIEVEKRTRTEEYWRSL